MWEAEKACKHKKLHYTELAAEVKQQGSSTKVCPIEVGSRGFVASSTIRLLKDLEIRGMALRHTIKSVSEAGERSSQWVCWAPRTSTKHQQVRKTEWRGGGSGTPNFSVEPSRDIVG